MLVSDDKQMIEAGEHASVVSVKNTLSLEASVSQSISHRSMLDVLSSSDGGGMGAASMSSSDGCGMGASMSSLLVRSIKSGLCQSHAYHFQCLHRVVSVPSL